jgi:hypothetical protein
MALSIPVPSVVLRDRPEKPVAEQGTTIAENRDADNILVFIRTGLKGFPTVRPISARRANDPRHGAASEVAA